MDSNIEVPVLDWVERYKRMIDAAYTVFFEAEKQIHKRCEEKKALEMRSQIHKALGITIARRLIKKFGLKPTVEDALKLLVLYSSEVWGFGAREYVSAKLESPNRGVYANLVCRGWEIAKKSGMLNFMKDMDCSKGCMVEYSAVVHTLDPSMKVTMTKAMPWGDNRCEFVLEKK